VDHGSDGGGAGAGAVPGRPASPGSGSRPFAEGTTTCSPPAGTGSATISHGSSTVRTGTPHRLVMVSHSVPGPGLPCAVTTNRAGP
jgi:hypothetical protein